jgi:hypothetical protein
MTNRKLKFGLGVGGVVVLGMAIPWVSYCVLNQSMANSCINNTRLLSEQRPLFLNILNIFNLQIACELQFAKARG